MKVKIKKLIFNEILHLIDKSNKEMNSIRMEIDSLELIDEYSNGVIFQKIFDKNDFSQINKKKMNS